MAKLKWNETGTRKYNVGVSNGVLYLTDAQGAYSKGVAWSGLTEVQESPSGAENTKLYADNTVYGLVTSSEDFGATINAYSSPEEFDECDGTAELDSGLEITQQLRKSFGFSYREEIRNDVSDNAGYIIHCVYGCKAQPSERTKSTLNDSSDVEALSWALETVPVSVTGKKPTAHVKINSTKFTPEQMEAVEAILYGTDDTEARLPLPDELNEILKNAKVQG